MVAPGAPASDDSVAPKTDGDDKKALAKLAVTEEYPLRKISAHTTGSFLLHRPARTREHEKKMACVVRALLESVEVSWLDRASRTGSL